MNTRKKGFLLTVIGVILMSMESPLILITNLSTPNFCFYFGLFLFLSTNLIILSKGISFFIKIYSVETFGIVLCGICMGFSNYFFILSVQNAGVAITVLVLATAPIMSAFLTFVISKEKTPARIYKSTAFVILGLFFIVFGDFNTSSLRGIIFAFLCVFCFSTTFVILSKYKKASRIAYVSLGGFFIGFFSIFQTDFHVSFNSLLIVALMGIIITPISRVMIGTGTRYLLPAEVSILCIAESALAPFWAWLWLNDIPSLNIIIGGCIIITTLITDVIMSLKTKKQSNENFELIDQPTNSSHQLKQK